MNVEIESFRFCIVFFFVFSSIRITSTAPEFDRITVEQSIRDGETVVSAGDRFELGFFSPGNSTRRYVGIWYKNINPRTSVWVANREAPLSDRSGFLVLNPKGTLEILNSTNEIIWSSNVTRVPQSPVAMLLISGNLVVRDEKDTNQGDILWQSFDYPGDTCLPGMKLGVDLETGHKWAISSWKSLDDPSKGDFLQRVYPQGVPQLCLKRGNETILRAGSWNGLTWSGVTGMKSNPVYNYTFVSNGKEVSYMYQVKNESVLMRNVIDPSGDIQQLTWVNQSQAWKGLFGKTQDECDEYAKCGGFAICNIVDYPLCTCFAGFKPRSERQWSESNWSAGCVRRTKLGCGGDKFIKLEAVKLPDTRRSWSDKNSDLEQCEESCLQNCSCTGYANLDVKDGGTGCLLWFNDLIDVKKIFEGGGQNLYVRVAASEIAKIKLRRKLSKKMIFIIVGASTLFVLGLLVSIVLICMWRIKHRKTDAEHDLDDLGPGDDIDVMTYDLKTIADATDNFSDKMKLGEGGFGLVYKGTLSNGQDIAIKRLSKSSRQGVKEFKNEVVLIAELQHRNLVKLLGCCVDKDERMLIYEYMPNQSLDYFIFDEMRRKLLDCSMRAQIIIGTARGLLYLHQDSRLRIIHRDLKVSNILLDNNMQPKISDFGLARIIEGDQVEAETNKIVGTYGYMPPEYALDGIFSLKSDVFSFGVMILEIVSGRRNRGFSVDHSLNLLGYAWTLWNDSKAWELIDQSLDSTSDFSEMLRCIHVGLLCVQQNPDDRPDMSTVVVWLGGEGQLPEPNQPGFFTSTVAGSNSSSKEQMSVPNQFAASLLEAR